MILILLCCCLIINLIDASVFPLSSLQVFSSQKYDNITLNSKIIFDAENILKLIDHSMSKETIHLSNRPYITLGYAQTIDGTISPNDRSRLELSSSTSFALLHSLRARSDGVLIGINTLIHDKPRLNVRNPLSKKCFDLIKKVQEDFSETIEQPRSIVIDSQLKLLEVPKIFLQKPIIFTCCQDPVKIESARYKLQEIQGEIVFCKSDTQNRCDINDCLMILKERFHMNKILLEGGAGMIQTFLEHHLVDQIVLIFKPMYFGGFRSLSHQLSSPRCFEKLYLGFQNGDFILFGKQKYLDPDTKSI